MPKQRSGKAKPPKKPARPAPAAAPAATAEDARAVLTLGNMRKANQEEPAATAEDARAVLSLRMPRPLHARLQRAAKEEMRPLSGQILKVLQDWLDARDAGSSPDTEDDELPIDFFRRDPA